MKISYTQIKSFNPCYDPKGIGMPENYEAELIDFIQEYRHKVKQKEDIQWVVLRNEFFTDKELRLFACRCAREALKLVENPDPRSINAIDVSERFANGLATSEELAAARDAARDAAWYAQIDELINMLSFVGARA